MSLFSIISVGTFRVVSRQLKYIIQWNHPERLIGSSVSQIAISESSRKRPPPVRDPHLSLTSSVVVYERFQLYRSIKT